MYRSASKSGFLDRMTFIQNGVDEERRTAHMSIDSSNNGGSFVKLGGDDTEIINERKNVIQVFQTDKVLRDFLGPKGRIFFINLLCFSKQERSCTENCIIA